MPRNHLASFTFVELLTVLVIVGILMLLGSGFSKNTRDTFVAQQYVKTLLNDARILRRKSMLISRNASDTSWVYGIGFDLKKTVSATEGTTWAYSKIRLISTQLSTSYYYRSYPGIKDNALTSDFLDGSENANALSSGLGVKVEIPTTSRSVEKDCVKDTRLEELWVVYESINGKMHAYCRVPAGAWIRLGAASDLASESEDVPDIKLTITLSATGRIYETKLHLRSNGEVNTTSN